MLGRNPTPRSASSRLALARARQSEATAARLREALRRGWLWQGRAKAKRRRPDSAKRFVAAGSAKGAHKRNDGGPTPRSASSRLALVRARPSEATAARLRE